MGTTLATIKPNAGARHKRKRVGRGPGSGNGTTAGKGMKGQRSRSGTGGKVGFEGGQMPLQRRLPKRGFVCPSSKTFSPVNVSDLVEIFEAGANIGPSELKEVGLVPRKAKLIKILGSGEMLPSHNLTVKAQAFSSSAKSKIEEAGGKTELLPINVLKTTSKKEGE